MTPEQLTSWRSAFDSSSNSSLDGAHVKNHQWQGYLQRCQDTATSMTLTPEWCEKILRALEDSVDSVSQEVFDHKKTWGETSISSRMSQRQSLEQTEDRHKAAIAFLQTLLLKTVLVNPPQSKKISP